MKLEKFDKYKKQKRIAMAAFISFLLILGGVKLYKTFAVYEVKKEFNILRGRVPAFSRGDIQFAVKIDDADSTSIPTKADSMLYTGYECNKPGVTIEWNNEKWGPLTLGLTEKGTSCTLKFVTTFAAKVNIGDYIAYTPSKTSYTISTTLTGYTSNQTINPSELNLWRVIRKNDNGTVDVVSEYVSSTNVYFQGKTGYEKLVGSLNTIAKQYETSGITVASRHMGFNGQTPTVSINTAYYDRTGDYEYTTDYELVKTAMGTTIAYKPNSTTASYYWLPSRSVGWSGTGYYYYYGRYVSENGSTDSGALTYYNNGSWNDYNKCYALRPIVTLNSSLNVVENIREDGKKIWKVN